METPLILSSVHPEPFESPQDRLVEGSKDEFMAFDKAQASVRLFDKLRAHHERKVDLSMNGSLHVRVDPPGDPVANMKADCALVQAIREGSASAILRMYQWNQPAISIGRRQSVEDLPPVFREAQSVLVRRPTGGGAVLHRLDERTYAFAVSRAALARQISIREIVGTLHRSLLQELVVRESFSVGDLAVLEQDAPGPATFCFSAPVCGDLMFQGHKVAGAALRVWRDLILVQGSIQGLPIGWDPLKEAFMKFYGAEGES